MLEYDSGIKKQKNSRSVNHLKIINKNDEYGTPQKVFLEGCNLWNIYPAVDVCAPIIVP